MNKEMKQATERELKDWPGVTFTEEVGKNHCKLTLCYQEQTALVIVSGTPGDRRAIPNHLSVLRREIRAMGAERAHVVVGKPKAKKPEGTTKIHPALEGKVMSKPAGIDTIFKTIGDLRYSEMLDLAEFLRDVATDTNLRRGRPESWAKMLQAAVDTNATEPTT